jgi:hypothetical protein
MAFIGPNDLLVLQKNDGRVRRVINGVLQLGDVLDTHVDNQSERGLLGIALHPNFPGTNFIYLYYTESSAAGDTSGSPLANGIYRYTWNAAQIRATGLDPCQPNPGQPSPPQNCALESSILISLNPGAYTVHLSGAHGVTGVGLLEIFQARD